VNVEVITTAQQLAELAPVWDRLVARAGAVHPFVTHTWIRTWWECFGAEGELRILVVRDDREPIAIAPLMRRKERIYGARHECLRFTANDHTPRCDFIVADKPVEAYGAISRFLLSESDDWDVVQLCDVPADSDTLRELANHAAQNGFLSGARRTANSPLLPTTLSWNDYLETLPPKRRWFLRNRMKRLSKLGRVSLETVAGGEGLQRALQDGLGLEAAAWKGKAGTAIQCDATLRRFYTLLAERAAEQGWLRLQFLKLDDKRIAFAYCLTYAKRMYLLKPGFDPEYAAFSPGNLLFFLALEECHSSDLVAYDFLGYDDHWKRQWADQSIAHDTLFLYAKRPLMRLDHYTRFALMPKLRRARNAMLGQTP
jgi:CelD/BcsL family acetyltransferase involved in cellulose biosynthesis